MKHRVLSLTTAMMLMLSTYAASVETDRPWYLSGEAMTVSIAADNASTAYAELCDVNGLAAGVTVGLKNGKGTGIVELPSDLHSGYYVLSVYTRDDTRVSQRLVAIVNPLRKSADDDIEWMPVSHPDSLSYALAGDGERAELIDEKVADEREIEGHIIKARVHNVYEGNTFSGSQILPSLSIIGKQIHYFEGRMVNDSTAVFYTFGIHGKQPLVISAMSSTGVSLPVEVISPFAALIPKKLPHLVFHYQRSEVETRSLDMQRHQIAITPAKRELRIGDYSDDTAEEGVPLDYDDKVFGYSPTFSYNLDEYRQFFTVKEVLIEYVVGVTRKEVNGVSQLSVFMEGNSNRGLPLVLIDGMHVYDTEQLLNYDARRIHYINIYDGEYTFGHNVYDGVISFVTRSGRLTNYPIKGNAQYLVYQFPDRN